MFKPDFRFEKKLWKKGFKFVAGCDEVGRGCFAGPVVAGCVVFSQKTVSTLQGLPLKGVRIDDSKKLTAHQRENAGNWIKENCVAWGVGLGSVAEINRVGMTKATNSAFRRAIKAINKKLNSGVEYLLIDAFYIPYIRGLRVGKKNGIKDRKKPKISKGTSRQLAIINGDEKSVSIAAASIIAKVYRDKLMTNLSKQYKKYGWDKNKGYGTKHHCDALIKFGETTHHRKKFVESYLFGKNLQKLVANKIQQLIDSSNKWCVI